MKKFLSFLLVLVILFSSLALSGCQKDDSPKDKNSIRTFDITSDYCITISENHTKKEISVAKDIQLAIRTVTKNMLTINDDGETPEKEIVIGNVERPELENIGEKVGEQFGYTVFTSGEKIFIYGTDKEYLELAANEFTETYLTSENPTLAIPEDLSIVRNHINAKPDLTINGVSIKEFVIVYGEEGATSPLRNNGLWIESGKYEDAANAFARDLKLLTGVELKVASARRATENDHEILIGKSSKRDDDDSFYSSEKAIEDYSFGVINGNLVLSGGSSNASYFAGKAFISACADMEGSDFTAAPKKGKAEFIKVACIGDSITNGTCSTDQNASNYPVFLQRMLGFDYYVGNYGWPGIRMTNYFGSTDHSQSCKLKPDVVIMMLGTNDAYYANDYPCDMENESYRTNYKNCGSNILKNYRSINPSVQIYVLTPPSILPNSNWRNGVKKSAAINTELAEELNCRLIDIYNISALGKWNFPDMLHPKDDGYRVLAKAIYDNLKDSIIGY